MLEHLRGAEAVVLEANHDPDWLRRGPYSAELKRRISSRRGHLSNRQAAEAALALAPHGLKDLVLAHLSKTNNSPARACGTVHSALREAGHGGVRVRAAIAGHPTPRVEVGTAAGDLGPRLPLRGRERGPATLRGGVVIRRATIVAVGRLKGWAADGCDDYLRRLRRYFPVEVLEVPEGDMNRRSPQEVLAAEAERLLKRHPANAHVVALDREAGKQLSSEALSRKARTLGLSGPEPRRLRPRRASRPLAGVRADARTRRGPSAT